jgi:hypothetical protein
MDTRTARKIERYARVNGMSWQRACSEFGKRGAAARQRKARQREAAEENEARFQAIREARPDLY